MIAEDDIVAMEWFVIKTARLALGRARQCGADATDGVAACLGNQEIILTQRARRFSQSNAEENAAKPSASSAVNRFYCPAGSVTKGAFRYFAKNFT